MLPVHEFLTPSLYFAVFRTHPTPLYVQFPQFSLYSEKSSNVNLTIPLKQINKERRRARGFGRGGRLCRGTRNAPPLDLLQFIMLSDIKRTFFKRTVKKTCFTICLCKSGLCFYNFNFLSILYHNFKLRIS